MRAGIEKWLLQHWYGTHRPPWYLRIFEPVYRFAFHRAQNRGNDGQDRCRSEIPLIVVGNVTVGGSGKTPLVIGLCQLAGDMNLKPGIACTGYGRQSNETLLVHADSDTRICGDEPVLLAIRTGSPVVVAERRCDAIRKLNEMNLDVIFSDDGLQQADLDSDLEFCVVDGARGLGNGHLLPAGPLRESADRLNRVDSVVTNGEWVGKPDSVDVSVMSLKADKVCSLDGSTTISADKFLQNHKGTVIHAVAGIGNPQRFFRTLEGLGFEVSKHQFPDHHMFRRKDFDFVPVGSAIIMTEKDAVKCRSLGLENAWYLPVDTHLADEFAADFKSRLQGLLKKRIVEGE